MIGTNVGSQHVLVGGGARNTLEGGFEPSADADKPAGLVGVLPFEGIHSTSASTALAATGTAVTLSIAGVGWSTVRGRALSATLVSIVHWHWQQRFRRWHLPRWHVGREALHAGQWVECSHWLPSPPQRPEVD